MDMGTANRSQGRIERVFRAHRPADVGVPGGSIFLSLFAGALFLAAAGLAQAAGSNVVVDFSQPQPATRSMSGFLGGGGITQAAPTAGVILPLQPRHWRLPPDDNQLTINPMTQDRIASSGARIQFMLGYSWRNSHNTTRPWPYENYAAYEDFVTQLARANASRQITMWDVWNEADRPSLGFWGGTLEQFFETYRRTYQILRRELGPDVLIGGPSFTHYNRIWLTQFLDYCNSNGCEVNFLSWHEFSDRQITSISDRIAEARSLFVNNPAYASLRIREIQINEVIGSFNQYSPSAMWGYFYYPEKGGADGAAKACWNDSLGSGNCGNGSLDGLVTPGAGEPRAAWWAQKTYADGADSRVLSTTSNPQVVALGSSRSASSSAAQVLVSYFRATPDDSPPVSSVSVELERLDSLSFIGASGAVRVKVEKIPSTGEAVVWALEPMSEREYPVVAGTANIPLDPVRPDDAYVLTITNATGTATQTGQSDCLFNWAERTYPTLFAPAGASSATLAPYYYRYYSQSRSYLGTSSMDGHVYYLGPIAGNSILDVGALSTWLATASCQ